MKCPQCKQSIMPYKILLLTRWTSIRCSNCGVQLRRKIDLQLMIITGIFSIALFFATELISDQFHIHPFPAFIAAAALILVFGSLVDAATVRLMKVKEDESEDVVFRSNG